MSIIAQGTPVRYRDADYYPVAIKAMREWIGDCQWSDLPEGEMDDLSDYEVLRGVDLHYAGGLPAFLTEICDCE